MIKRCAAAAAVRPCVRPDPGSPPSSFPQVTCLDRSGGPVLPPLFGCEMRAPPALVVLVWSGDGSPIRGCTTTTGDQVPPRTPKPGKFPAQQASLEHAARPPASRAVPAPPRGETAMTAPLIVPLIPPRARPGTRGYGRRARPADCRSPPRRSAGRHSQRTWAGLLVLTGQWASTLRSCWGCSPWRPQSKPTVSQDAVTDGGGGVEMRRKYPPY
jgi:hypothetical protein